AGHREVQLLAVGQGHHDLARLQAGDQRRVLGRDAELAELAGGDQQYGLAVEDLFLGTDDVATERGCHLVSRFTRRGRPLPASRGRAARAGAEASSTVIFLPFSAASSIEPTMENAC